MNASLRIGRIFGAEVRLHVSLLLLIPYALLAFRPASPARLLQVGVLLVAVFICVALHEIGHTAAARLFGYQVNSIVLWPLGGVANFDRRPDKVLPDVVMTAAGPLTNLLIFIYLALLVAAGSMVNAAQILPALTGQLWRDSLFPMLFGLAVANLSLAVFNLIPVYPLDGGQIARSLLKFVFGERASDWIMLIISLPAAAGLVILGVVLGDILVILTGLLLVLAAFTLHPRLINSLNMGWLYLFDRAAYHLRRNDFDPAAAEYTRLIQRSPQSAGLYTARAVVYFQLAALDLAEADINRALELDTSNYLAWLLRGELLWMKKDAAETLTCYNRAIQLQPKGALAYLDRGMLYLATGDYQRAAQDMDKGVAFGRGSPLGFFMRSIARYQMGDRAGAKSDAVRAQRFAPLWMLTFSPAFEETVIGHLNWALDYYALALERLPGSYQVYQGRADACLVNGRPDWALADYHRALHLAPRNAGLYFSRGLSYARLGKPDLAAADFSQAAALADRAHIRRQAIEQYQKIVRAAERQPVSPAPTAAQP